VFALLGDEVLYLKVDDQMRAAFEAEGCGPFTYDTKDGQQVMGAYQRAPERLLDEPDELVAWAKLALAVGHRAARAKPTPKSRKT
jgi:DNA transformation protein and related proteins